MRACEASAVQSCKQELGSGQRVVERLPSEAPEKLSEHAQ